MDLNDTLDPEKEKPTPDKSAPVRTANKKGAPPADTSFIKYVPHTTYAQALRNVEDYFASTKEEGYIAPAANIPTYTRPKPAEDPGPWYSRTAAAVVRGVGRGVNEVSNSVVDVGKVATKYSGLYKLFYQGDAEKEWLEWYDAKTGENNPLTFDIKKERDTGIYGFIEGISQFSVGMFGASKVIKPISFMGKGMQVARTAQLMRAESLATTMIRGAAVDAFAFDPHEERLANWLESVGPEWSREIAGFFAAKEDDSVITGRMKNMAEGLVLGSAMEGLIAGFHGWRAGAAARKAGKSAAEAAEAAEKAAAEYLTSTESLHRQLLDAEKDIYRVEVNPETGRPLLTADIWETPDGVLLQRPSTRTGSEALRIASDAPPSELEALLHASKDKGDKDLLHNWVGKTGALKETLFEESPAFQKYVAENRIGYVFFDDVKNGARHIYEMDRGVLRNLDVEKRALAAKQLGEQIEAAGHNGVLDFMQGATRPKTLIESLKASKDPAERALAKSLSGDTRTLTPELLESSKEFKAYAKKHNLEYLTLDGADGTARLYEIDAKGNLSAIDIEDALPHNALGKIGEVPDIRLPNAGAQPVDRMGKLGVKGGAEVATTEVRLLGVNNLSHAVEAGLRESGKAEERALYQILRSRAKGRAVSFGADLVEESPTLMKYFETNGIKTVVLPGEGNVREVFSIVDGKLVREATEEAATKAVKETPAKRIIDFYSAKEVKDALPPRTPQAIRNVYAQLPKTKNAPLGAHGLPDLEAIHAMDIVDIGTWKRGAENAVQLPKLAGDIAPALKSALEDAWDIVANRYPRIAATIEKIEIAGAGFKDKAGFKPGSRTLTLHPETPITPSVLFHEFVHAAQAARRRFPAEVLAGKRALTVAEIREFEREAYAAQFKKVGLEFGSVREAELHAAAMNRAVKVRNTPHGYQGEAKKQLQKYIALREQGVPQLEAARQASPTTNPKSSLEELLRGIEDQIEATRAPNVGTAGDGVHIPREAQVERGLQKAAGALTPEQQRILTEGAARASEETASNAVAVMSVFESLGNELRQVALAFEQGKVGVTAREMVERLDHFFDTAMDYLKVRANAGRTLDIFNVKELPQIPEYKGVRGAVEGAGSPQGFSAITDNLSQSQLEALGRLVIATEGDPEKLFELARLYLERPIAAATKNSTWFEQINGVRLNMMLSGLKTQVVTSTSSAFVALARPVHLWWAGVRTGNAALRDEAKFLLASMFSRETIVDSLEMAKKAFREGVNVLDAKHKIDEFGLGQFSLGGPETIGRAVSLPSRLIMTNDEFFKQLTYRSEVRARSLRNSLDAGITDGAKIAERLQADMDMAFTVDGIGTDLRALDRAREVTMTRDLRYGFGKDYQELVKQYPIFSIATPFVKTSVNLFRYTWEMTPLLNKLNKDFAAEIAAGGERAAIARAKQEFGLMLYSSAAFMAVNGEMTGAGPRDPGLRELWLKKYQPYSIKVGGTWISMKRIDPFSTPLMLIGDFYDAVGGGKAKDAEEAAYGLMAAMVSSTVDKTYMVGMAELLGAMHTRNASVMEAFIEGQLLSFVPNFARQTNPDPYYREARTLVEKFKARVGGFSETLEPERNMFGEKIMLAPGWFNRAFNPFTMMTPPEDADVHEAIYLLGKALPMKPSRYGNVDFKNREAYDNGTGQSPWDRWLELVNAPINGGPNLKTEMTQLIRSERWAQAGVGSEEYPGGERALLAGELVNEHWAVAKEQMLREYPLLERALMQQADEREAARGGTSFTQALLGGN